MFTCKDNNWTRNSNHHQHENCPKDQFPRTLGNFGFLSHQNSFVQIALSVRVNVTAAIKGLSQDFVHNITELMVIHITILGLEGGVGEILRRLQSQKLMIIYGKQWNAKL